MLFGQVIRPAFLTLGPKQSKISKDSQMRNSNLLRQKSKLSMRPKRTIGPAFKQNQPLQRIEK